MARQSLAGPFAEAAFKLQPSTCAKPVFTDPPVKTGHGFHVIMCVVDSAATSDQQGRGPQNIVESPCTVVYTRPCRAGLRLSAPTRCTAPAARAALLLGSNEAPPVMAMCNCFQTRTSAAEAVSVISHEAAIVDSWVGERQPAISRTCAYSRLAAADAMARSPRASPRARDRAPVDCNRCAAGADRHRAELRPSPHSPRRSRR